MGPDELSALREEIDVLRQRVAAVSANDSPTERLTLQELQIVEPGGTVRVLVTGHADDSGGAGIVLKDASGSEYGRLTHRAAMVDGEPDAEEQLQLGPGLRLAYRQAGSERSSSLEIRDGDAGQTRRIFLGTEYGTAKLELCDGEGRPRIRLSVSADGVARAEELDAAGNATRSLLR